MKILIHSLILAATVLLTYLWAGHPNLSHYTLQLVGILALTYVLLHKFTNRLYHPTGLLNLEGALFLTAITLLMVFSTGGASSPLFFVLYFLLFALSLLFEPVQTAILSLLLLPPLFLEISHFGQAVTPGTWGNLAALVLITPMAVVFGRKLIELQHPPHHTANQSLAWSKPHSHLKPDRHSTHPNHRRWEPPHQANHSSNPNLPKFNKPPGSPQTVG